MYFALSTRGRFWRCMVATMQNARELLRRSAIVASGMGISYAGARFAEEVIPWVDIERSYNAERDEELWRCTHPVGTEIPIMSADAAAENHEHALKGATSILALAAAQRDNPSIESFDIVASASAISGAGNGAHISGRASRGQVLTFYYGPVYPPITGRIALTFMSIFMDSKTKDGASLTEYILISNTGYIMQGLDNGTTSSSRGPLVNHVVAGAQPNVMYYGLLIDASTLQSAEAVELRRLNWYAFRPWTFHAHRWIHTVVVVALRDLCNEELFADYGYPPGPAVPDWYTPVASTVSAGKPEPRYGE